MPIISAEDTAPPRILIIDDNPSVHDAFKEILCRRPVNESLEREEEFMFGASDKPRVPEPAYQTDHAMSGAEGVEKVGTALAANAPYQLAFVDIRMPGMDGVETIERLWKLDQQVQTVICTAYADYRWEDLAARFGKTDRLLVLKKPFHDIEVLQLASTLVRKWYLAREAAMKVEQAEMLVARRTQALLEFQRREHERLEELDQTKLRHLTQLAQEFRGPLTVMLQALEQPAPDNLPGPAARESLLRNAQKLVALVDDSLLMRRLEVEDCTLDSAEIEIVAFIRGLVRMFEAEGRKRAVEIHFQSTEAARKICTDPAKLEKALFNLFARALSTAAEGGNISVQLRFDGNLVRLQIEIPRPAKLVSVLPEQDIGWLLSGEILRMLGGHLCAELWGKSAEDARRPVTILVDFPADQPQPMVTGAEQAGTQPAASDLEVDRDLPVVLVIEQNEELRRFIRQGLGAGYSVLEAEDAGRGLAAARDNVPDLMVVGGDASRDDGVKICTDLKRDEMTSHIPVILLPTDDSDASHLRALQAGVNEFLAKPFRLPLLKACADNLLENRRKLHEHFQHLQIVQPRELATNQMDAEFLRKVVEIVDRNLADYEFDVEKLARQMAVSRRQLFRKFKALAGCTPNVFIRDIRLKRAAQLLRDSHLTVSEIIYAVGFSDPKYFRSIFRERFGVLPGEFGKSSRADA
ncbi:MAG TPA: response regulator [Candidatus Acidoferrales bacterium]|nr:response regulator [Candidatus Acidoferrales bacterium]